MQTNHVRLIRSEETERFTFLEYEGSKEGLLAAGVGYPALFRVGKSGKRIVQRGFGETDEFTVERLKNRWRVIIYREKPEPLAAPGVWILDRSVDNDGIESTWYVGTKKALLASGFASTHMFRLGKKTYKGSNRRHAVPVHERFNIRRYRAYWKLWLYRQIEANEKPALEEITNEDKPTQKRGVVIPFPGVQL